MNGTTRTTCLCLRSLLCTACLLIATPILFAQAPPPPPPAPDAVPPVVVQHPRKDVPLLPADSVPEQKITFDIVSVKAHKAEDCNQRSPCLNRVELPTNGDGFAFRGATIYTVLHFAYGGNGRGGEWAVLGQPKWVDTDLYDIRGKVTEEDIPAWQKMDPDTKRIAVRELLRDMLKLKVHEDAKEVPIYALVVGKNGPKMKEYQPGDTVKTPDGRLLQGTVLAWFTPNELVCQAMDMDRLANSLNPRIDHTVLDRTGLTGLYNFTLEINWMRAPTNPEDADPSVPSVFTSIQKLGLELKPAKGDPHNLVIDHIERPVTD